MFRGLTSVVSFVIAAVLLPGFTSFDSTGNESEPEEFFREAADRIDPFIGASTEQTDSKHGLGKTFPGAATPFGLVQLSPDTITGGDNGSGYSYHHASIEGFSFLHLSGVGAYGDLGNLLVTPTVGPIKTDYGSLEKPDEGYRSRFRHETEIARAGYYAVTLDDYDVRAELSATPHAGILRFTFPETESGRVQIDLARKIGGTSLRQYVRVLDDRTIEGWMICGPEGGGFRRHGPRYTVYFYGRFSRPFSAFGGWSARIPDGIPRGWAHSTHPRYREIVRKAEISYGRKELEGRHIGFFAEFPMEREQELVFKAGISFVDLAGARRNLEAEIPGFDFDRVRDAARESWARAMSSVRIEGATEEQKTIFYTALYHAMIDPRIFADTDGRYVGADFQIQREQEFTYRTVFSGWDVFRSQVPLLTIFRPDVVNDEIRSLIEIGERSGMGCLPRWELLNHFTGGMNGDPAITVIADAYAKGIRDFDVERAYALCRQSSLGPCIRRGLEDFNDLGYATDPERGVSLTLEYAYADWCLAQLARALDKRSDHELFMKRAGHYVNVYHAGVRSVRLRNRDGTWAEWGGREEFGQGCFESNPLQQGWFVPHDVQGLIRLVGEETFLQELVAFLEGAPEDFSWSRGYNHPNETCHHVPYLFTYAGAPWFAQKWTRRIVDQGYGTGVGGLRGNDDAGQMSAWYVLSAIGFHPVCPGDGIYVLGSPRFREVVIRLDPQYHEGEVFRIIAHDNSDQNVYIQSARLNGVPLPRAWITHEEIAAGGTLELDMGAEPDTEWGAAESHRPPSGSGVDRE